MTTTRPRYSNGSYLRSRIAGELPSAFRKSRVKAQMPWPSFASSEVRYQRASLCCLTLRHTLPAMKDHVERLLHPDRLYTALDVAGRPCPVPARPGVYAWYFTEPLPYVATSACHRAAGQLLLYVGISPKAPPLNGRSPSKSTLRQRIRTHYFGNAEGSTLRRTLGCLLDIQLRRVGAEVATPSPIPASSFLISGWRGTHSSRGSRRMNPGSLRSICWHQASACRSTLMATHVWMLLPPCVLETEGKTARRRA